MKLQIFPVTKEKSEHKPGENEDQFKISRDQGIFVVADGVGETGYAREWAELLVDYYSNHPILSEDPFEVEHWVRATQKALVPLMPDPYKRLTIMSEENIRKGSAATLLGLRLTQLDTADEQYGYVVEAVGDTNFFHWRPNEEGRYVLQCAFPLTDSSQFDTAPNSLNSRNFDRDATPVKRLEASSPGTLRPYDVLMLATDAVASWLLQAYEEFQQGSGPHPIEMLRTLSEGNLIDSWPTIVEQLRRSPRRMENDDSTLILIAIEDGETPANFRPQAHASYLEPETQPRTSELVESLAAWLEGHGRDIDVAVAFGDGRQIAEPLRSRLSEPQTLDHGMTSHLLIWRANATAFGQVLTALSRFNRLPHPEQRNALEQVWDSYRTQLVPLPWTQDLVSTLRRRGLEPSTPVVELARPETETHKNEQATSNGISPNGGTEPGDNPTKNTGSELPLDGTTEQVTSTHSSASVERTRLLRKKVLDWVAGRDDASSIIAAYGDGVSIEPTLQAVLNTPARVGESTWASHLQLWEVSARSHSAESTLPDWVGAAPSAGNLQATGDTAVSPSARHAQVPSGPVVAVPHDADEHNLTLEKVAPDSISPEPGTRQEEPNAEDGSPLNRAPSDWVSEPADLLSDDVTSEPGSEKEGALSGDQTVARPSPGDESAPVSTDAAPADVSQSKSITTGSPPQGPEDGIGDRAPGPQVKEAHGPALHWRSLRLLLLLAASLVLGLSAGYIFRPVIDDWLGTSQVAPAPTSGTSTPTSASTTLTNTSGESNSATSGNKDSTLSSQSTATPTRVVEPENQQIPFTPTP